MYLFKTYIFLILRTYINIKFSSYLYISDNEILSLCIQSNKCEFIVQRFYSETGAVLNTRTMYSIPLDIAL